MVDYSDIVPILPEGYLEQFAVRVHIHICIYIYIYICISVYIYIYIHLFIGMHMSPCEVHKPKGNGGVL